MSSFTLDDSISQWCSGNYEIIYSSLKQIIKIKNKRYNESYRRDESYNTNLYNSIFYRRSDKNVEYNDVIDDSDDDNTSNDTIDKLNQLKQGVIKAFKNLMYYKPHMIPKRDVELNNDDLVKYINYRFPDLLNNINNIDNYSRNYNVNQYLCCELLYEGISLYGIKASQYHSEDYIIENMLHRQYKFQIDTILLLFSFVNNGNPLIDNRYNPDIIFPDSLDIFNDLTSNNLIENVCLLLLGAIKISSKNNSSSSSISKLIKQHSIEVVNDVLYLISQYFTFFHATDKQYNSIISLLPHIINLHEMFNIPTFTNPMSMLFNEYNSIYISTWYPTSHNLTSLFNAIKDYEDSSNDKCSTSIKLYLIIVLVMDLNLYRFKKLSPIDINTNVHQYITDSLSKSPVFKAYNNINITLEFILYGIQRCDFNKCIHYINIGVFNYLRHHVECLDHKFINKATFIINNILSSFFIHDGLLNSNWYSLLDYEIYCKRKIEEYSRHSINDVIDESIYRHSGKSIIELLQLLSTIDTRQIKTMGLLMWKSCVESYKSLTNSQYVVYKFNSFDSECYNVKDVNNIDPSVIKRLTTPEKTFTWWERNCALYELISIASDKYNATVETFPKIFTVILNFANILSHHDIEVGKSISKILNSGTCRDFQFPFILDKIITQIGLLSRDGFNKLHEDIFDHIIARDDQIETAEFAVMISSSMPSDLSNNVSLDRNCIKRMYTFPLIHSSTEVKIALSTLGLGGSCPFGLIETSCEVFKLISNLRCNRLGNLTDNLNIQMNYKGDCGITFYDAIFSILSLKFIPHTEMLLSSILDSLASMIYEDDSIIISALEKLTQLINNKDSMLGRSIEDQIPGEFELCSLMKTLKKLFISIPRHKRFNIYKTDWLYSLVLYSLKILDYYCLNKNIVIWDIIEHVLDFLYEISIGPICCNKSRATEYLLEQILIPGSFASISILRAANEKKIIPAISLLSVLFKRDVILLLAHRVSLFQSNKTCERCPCCNKLYQTSNREPSSNNALDWWIFKIQNINNIFSSSKSTPSNSKCQCIKLNMRPTTLLTAHECILEAFAKLKSKQYNHTDCSPYIMGSISYDSSIEVKMKSLYILIQMVVRVGIDSSFISDDSINNVLCNLFYNKPRKQHPEFIIGYEFESQDLVLYNQVSDFVSSIDGDVYDENLYFSHSHLNNMHRFSYDDLIYYFLNVYSSRYNLIPSSDVYHHRLFNDEYIIINLIKLSSDESLWDFNQWYKIDALNTLVSVIKCNRKNSRLITTHWNNLLNDIVKINFQILSHELFIVQSIRISLMVQLLTVLYGSNFISCDYDLTPIINLCLVYINVSCDLLEGKQYEIDEQLKKIGSNVLCVELIKYWNEHSCCRFMHKNGNLFICTRLLKDASPSLMDDDNDLSQHITDSTIYNLIIPSSSFLLSSMLEFITEIVRYNNSCDKLKYWLELSSTQFNPDDDSNFRLVLITTFIKSIAKLLNKSQVSHHDSSFFSSIIIKLITYLLSQKTAINIRCKIYSCINVLLSNTSSHESTIEIIITNLLHGTFNFDKSHGNMRLLQLLFNDSCSDSQSNPSLNNQRFDLKSINVGYNFKRNYQETIDAALDFEASRNLEMFYISIDGSIIDCRIESLKLLTFILRVLSKFESSLVEYDNATLCYGSLGIICSKQLEMLIKSRLLNINKCKGCNMNPPYCQFCLQLFHGAINVVESISMLHQFTSFWFYVRPSSEPCLAELILSCDLLLNLDLTLTQSIKIISSFMNIIESIINIPSCKTRLIFINWLNRHSGILSTVLSFEITPDIINITCRLLRIYRVLMIWKLTDYHVNNENSNLYTDGHDKLLLAINPSQLMPILLTRLISMLNDGSDSVWQCVLLFLQTSFPELGAFEIHQSHLSIKQCLIDKINIAFNVMINCSESLLTFIQQLSLDGHTHDALPNLALRISTVDCSITFLEYILSLVSSSNHDSNITNGFNIIASNINSINTERLTLIINGLYNVCKDNGVTESSLNYIKSTSVTRDKVEYLLPYELEHVPSFNNVRLYSYSFKSLLNILFSSLCNLELMMEKYHGSKFSRNMGTFNVV